MVLFALLAVGFGIGIVLAFHYSNSPIPAFLCIMGVCFSLLFAGVCYTNNVAKAKVETLKKVGYEPLTKEVVYNTSQAELDKMYKISTLGGIYYYNIEEETK